MKKKAIFLLLMFLMPIWLSLLSYSQSSVGVGLRIRDVMPPNISMITPPCRSFSHGNISLRYNVSDSSNVPNCTLIINNKVNLTNESISGGASLNFSLSRLPVGSYNYSINCTDSGGFMGNVQTFNFAVNSMTKFNGSTTDISSFGCEKIKNFSLEISDAGRITFGEGVNLSTGFDFDSYVNMSFNRISLDSNALREFNRTATLQLVGLAFSDPRILFNGVACPETICKKISYSGGVLTFNVSHWTSYESEETPTESQSQSASPTSGGSSGGSGSGGGGGGGGHPAIPIVTDFTLDKTSLKVTLKQGETKKETLSIKNIGTTIFDVKAALEEIGKFQLSPETGEITTTLNPNEEKAIEFVFKALENDKPEIYPGKITFKSPSTAKEIAAVIEIDSAQPLFDVDVEVLPDSKTVFPGQELSLEVNLFNVRGFGRVDVEVEYSIKDLKGNVAAAEHETLAVETQAKFTRRLLVPSDLLPGSYVAFAKVTYADSVGVSSDLFEVKAKAIRLSFVQLKDYNFFLIIGAVVLVLGILLFSARKLGYLKKKTPKTAAEESKQLKEEEKAQKLRKELEALETAHKSGFISEESYQRGRKRIEDKLNSLK